MEGSEIEIEPFPIFRSNLFGETNLRGSKMQIGTLFSLLVAIEIGCNSSNLVVFLFLEMGPICVKQRRRRPQDWN